MTETSPLFSSGKVPRKVVKRRLPQRISTATVYCTLLPHSLLTGNAIHPLVIDEEW